MQTRRNFIKNLVITGAGLLVAKDALEMLLEPRRKLWSGARFETDMYHYLTESPYKTDPTMWQVYVNDTINTFMTPEQFHEFCKTLTYRKNVDQTLIRPFVQRDFDILSKTKL